LKKEASELPIGKLAARNWNFEKAGARVFGFAFVISITAQKCELFLAPPVFPLRSLAGLSVSVSCLMFPTPVVARKRGPLGCTTHRRVAPQFWCVPTPEWGLGATYALQARQAIAALRKREPAVEIEIR